MSKQLKQFTVSTTLSQYQHVQCQTYSAFLTSKYTSFTNPLYHFWASFLFRIQRNSSRTMKWNTSFITRNFHKPSSYLNELSVSTYQNVLISVWRIITMVGILLVVRGRKMSNVSDSWGDSQYIFKTRRFYFIRKRSLKCMGKTLRNSTRLKVKPLTWFITLKGWMSSKGFLLSIGNLRSFIWKLLPFSCHLQILLSLFNINPKITQLMRISVN